MNNSSKSIVDQVFDAMLKNTLKELSEEEIENARINMEEKNMEHSISLDKKIKDINKNHQMGIRNLKIIFYCLKVTLILLLILFVHLMLYNFVDAYRKPIESFLMEISIRDTENLSNMIKVL